MRHSIICAASMMLLIGAVAVPDARADSCYDPNNQDFSCNDPAKPASPAAAPAPSSQLRERLRKTLENRGGAAPAKNLDAIEQRWSDAQARAQDATYRGQQTDDPQAKATLKAQYETAMRDLHQAGKDLVAADPQQKTQIQALLKDYDAQGAKAAAAAGLEAAPKTAADTPQKPTVPDNVTQIGDNTYVCDKTIAGGNNVSCRQISADSKQCTNVMLADGDVSWQDSIATPCRTSDLAQRKAFLARDPDAAAAVAGAAPSFAMSSDETRREIDRLMTPALSSALDALPQKCRANFEKFLTSGETKSKANAAQAAASYAAIDKDQPCRDAVKRIAGVLNVGLPHRKIAADQRNDWSAALAGPERASVSDVPEIDISNIPDTGFDPGDSLDSAIDMLNALSGGLGGLSGATRSTPGYRPAPAVRTRAPSSPPVQYHPPAPVQTCAGTYVCSAQ